MSERVWIGAAGAPPLLLPNSLLPDWAGIDVPEYRIVTATFRWNDKEPRASDYDRACDVADEVGVIPVGHGQGLVLTNSAGFQATTWLPRTCGGLLARWQGWADDLAMEGVIAGLPDSLSYDGKGDFAVTSSPLTLFNSAEPGVDPVMHRLSIELTPGRYLVGWTRYAQDLRAFGLIELRRAPT